MSSHVFINEFHYDNAGDDIGEFIELAGLAGTDLTGWSLVLYNGSNGTVYDTVNLSGIIPNQNNGFGFVVTDFPANGIQNGAPDGIALVDSTNAVIEFLSYEGSLTAVEGPADGLTSADIGVSESSNTQIGESLQLINSVWSPPTLATKGTANGFDNGGGHLERKLIHEIQGNGPASRLEGQTVTVEAIVVGDFQGSNGLSGFFLQEEDIDADADATTSEGLFVFDGGSPGSDIQVGDLVSATGTVTEFNGLTQLTNISSVDIISSNNALPTAATVNFPIAGDAELEAVEGMLVTIPETLFVTEYFNLDRFGEVRLAADSSNNAPGTDGRLDQYTQFNAPDIAGFAQYQAEIAKRQIILDDGSDDQNPDTLIFGRGGNPVSSTNTLRGGDTVTGLTGILDERFGDYRIQSNEGVDFQAVNERPNMPEDVGGALKVASFNVLNFFTTLDVPGNPGSGPNNLEPRGADSQAEFDRQLEKLVTTLATIDADIVGLIELENEFGSDQNGDGQFAIDTLVDALNAEVGAGTYAFVDPGQNFVDTGDAISVGAIYKTDTVQVASGTTVEILDDSDLTGLGLNFSNAVFDGPSTNRAPLAVTFEEISSGEQLTVAVNHFKSKGGDGTGDDADIGDGQGNFNSTRLRGAQALNTWLKTDPTSSGDPDFLIIGDLNAYAQEDPIKFLEAQGYTNVDSAPESAYSFVFNGQFGTLDYGLANQSLISQVTGMTEWHVNADELDALDYNLDFGRDLNLFDGTTPFRNSDHDPLIIGLDLSSASQNENAFGFSSDKDTTVGNAEDIIRFDGEGGFSTLFDGSAVGLSNANIDAFDVVNDTMILISFDRALTLAGLGKIDDSDVVKFTATALGEGNTAGSFERYLDGSDLGLTKGTEDIDALIGLADGSLLFSTKGEASLSDGLEVKDEDLVRFVPTSLGAKTRGEASLYFDGSDVGLTRGSEDIDAIGMRGDQLLLSTKGNFNVSGLSGRDEDIFSFTPTAIGDETSGNFAADLFFNGSQFGFTNDLAAIDFSIG